MTTAAETKHTPGPWRAAIEPKDTFPHKGNVYGPDGIIVAAIGDRFYNNVANAQLISAAPDMLDALEALVGEWRTTRNMWRMEEFAQVAEAAIRKARGSE